MSGRSRGDRGERRGKEEEEEEEEEYEEAKESKTLDWAAHEQKRALADSESHAHTDTGRYAAS